MHCAKSMNRLLIFQSIADKLPSAFLMQSFKALICCFGNGLIHATATPGQNGVIALDNNLAKSSDKILATSFVGDIFERSDNKYIHFL